MVKKLSGHPWSKEEEELLKEYYGKIPTSELVRMHNARFPLQRTINAMHSYARKLGLNIPCSDRWTEEELQFIRDNAKGISFKELSELHNERFPVKRTEFACQRMATRLGVVNGRDEKIKPNVPAKYRKGIGSVITDSNGDIWVKVRDEFVGSKDKRRNGNDYLKNYKRLSHINWEKENPPLKDGEKLMFLDGDHSNCDVSNLVLVTDSIIADMMRNKFHGIEDPQLKQCAIDVSKLNVELYECRKRGK